jgi:hypothetical protein
MVVPTHLGRRPEAAVNQIVQCMEREGLLHLCKRARDGMDGRDGQWQQPEHGVDRR